MDATNNHFVKKMSEKNHKYGVCFPKPFFEKMLLFSDERGVTVSSLVKMAVSEYMERYNHG